MRGAAETAPKEFHIGPIDPHASTLNQTLYSRYRQLLKFMLRECRSARISLHGRGRRFVSPRQSARVSHLNADLPLTGQTGQTTAELTISRILLALWTAEEGIELR
jgi:hypothetical protein